jgi:hypothetical protein
MASSRREEGGVPVVIAAGTGSREAGYRDLIVNTEMRKHAFTMLGFSSPLSVHPVSYGLSGLGGVAYPGRPPMGVFSFLVLAMCLLWDCEAVATS